MLIEQVNLENIKSYEKVSVRFSPGTNAICGQNGAGKSTLIEAIGLALFGSQRVKQEQLIRTGAAFGRIEVAFTSSLDGLTYYAKRELRRSGPSPATLVSAALNLEMASGVRGVQEELLQHLGLGPGARPASLFEGVIGVPQGQLTTDFLLSDAPRKARFEELLALQEYELAHQRLSRPLQWGRARLANLEGKLEMLEAQLTDHQAARDRDGELRRLLGEAQARLQAVTGSLETVRAQRLDLDRRQEEVDRQREQLAAAQSALGLARERATQAERLVAEALQAAETALAAKSGHDAYIEWEGTSRQLEAQMAGRESLRQQLHLVGTSLATLEANLASIRQRLDRAAGAGARTEQLAPLVVRQEQLEQDLAEARRREAKRADLGKQLAGLESTLKRRLSEQEDLARERTDLADVPSLLERAERTRQETRGRIAEEEARGNLLDSEIKSQEEAAEAVRLGEGAACPVCGRPFEAGDSQSFLAHLAEQTQANQGRRRQCRQVLTALRKQATTAEAESTRLGAELDRLRRVEAAAGPLQEGIQALEDEREEVGREFEALVGLEETTIGLEQELASLGDARSQMAVATSVAAEGPAIERDLASATARHQEAEKKHEGLSTALDQYEGLEDRLAQARAARDGYRRDYDSYERFHPLAEQLPARSQEQEARQSALAEAQAAHAGADESLASLLQGYNPDHHRSVREEERGLEASAAEARARTSGLETQVEESRERLEALAALEKQRDDLRLQVKRDGEAIESLRFLREAIRATGPEMARRVLSRVSRRAYTCYAELMGDYALELRWEDDYGITVRRGGETREFAQLSGGEQMAAALAVRLGLLRELSDVRIAFFDEPTVNLDSDRRRGLADQIRGIRDLDQLFVISHDDSLEGVTENVIRIVQEDGKSRVETA